jgi:glycosyltransferase involved in cell wall biosynthesis
LSTEAIMNDANPSMIAGTPAKEPLVSIGVPTYNRPAGLRKLLASIEKQTYSNLEIIISDNCSTNPEVSEIIRQYAAKDQRVKPFRQSENVGLENNFNFVYWKATGIYFMWMSDDDYFDDNYVSECMNFLLTHPDYMLCSGVAYYYTDGAFTFKENMLPVCQESPFRRASAFFNKMQQNGKFYGVFRNKILDSDPLGKHIGCDWTFMTKMAILGKVTYTDKTSYHRAIGGNSATRKTLVKRYGFKGFKKIFMESYSAYVISTNIFSDGSVRKKFGWFKRTCLVIIAFIKIHFLSLLHSIRIRLKGRNYYKS